MHHPYTADPHPLARKLESIVELTSEERVALHAIPLMERDLHARQDIVREGDRPSQACLILEGWAFRYKIARGSRRQIFSFHIPGDTPDLLSVHLKTMDHSPRRLPLIASASFNIVRCTSSSNVALACRACSGAIP